MHRRPVHSVRQRRAPPSLQQRQSATPSVTRVAVLILAACSRLAAADDLDVPATPPPSDPAPAQPEPAPAPPAPTKAPEVSPAPEPFHAPEAPAPVVAPA